MPWIKKHPIKTLLLCFIVIILGKVSIGLVTYSAHEAKRIEQNILPNGLKPVEPWLHSVSNMDNCGIYVYRLNPAVRERIKKEKLGFLNAEARQYPNNPTALFPKWKSLPADEGRGSPISLTCSVSFPRDILNLLAAGLRDESNYYTTWNGRPFLVYPEPGIVIFHMR